MENTAQASIKISRLPTKKPTAGVYLPRKMAQSATMESPQLATRPGWLTSTAPRRQMSGRFYSGSMLRHGSTPILCAM